jgi:hypothetical protein
MRKQSNSFKEFKTQEYFKALAESVLQVRRAINSDFAKNTFIDELAKWIAKSNASIYEVPSTIFDKFAEKNVGDITAKYFAKVQVEFNKVLTTNFESMIKLALRHQMYDYLYEYGDDDIRKYFDSVVITEDTKELSAEFASYEEENKNKIRYSLTKRAVENLLKQRAEQTNINDVAKIQERVKIADEVSRNVYMLNKISDSTNSAKAAMMNFLYGSSDEKQNFISSNYLGKRRRVLQASYSTESNKQIRKAVALFLADNREYITNIKSQRNKYEYDLNLLKVRIRNIINKDVQGFQNAFKQQSPDAIIKTELSIAYNFGKIAAFGGLSDRYKRFKWNVDREYALISRYKRLASGSKRADPVPCLDCETQDGLEYYLFEILENQRNNGDVLNYKKGNPTVWRNHSKPSIPFHVQCQCWTASSDVVMYNRGNKKISEIVVGDLISVPTADKFKKVTKVHKNWYEGKIIRISFESQKQGRKTITCTENHPIWTKERGWVTANNLRVGDNTFEYFKTNGESSSTEINIYPNKKLPSVCEGIGYLASKFAKNSKLRRATATNSIPEPESKQQVQGFPRVNFGSIFNGSWGEASKNYKTLSQQFQEAQQRNSRKVQEWSIHRTYLQGIKNNWKASEKYIKGFRFIQTDDKSVLEDLYELRCGIEGRLQRRFTAIFPFWLGGECSKSTDLLKNSLGIRVQSYKSYQWNEISARFLPTRFRQLYRGEGALDRNFQRESESLSKHGLFTLDNRHRFVQGFEESFQGLSEVRVVSIEEKITAEYVYNLTVEDIPIYLVDGLVVHNCYWSLVEDIDEEDFDPKKQPPNRPPQGGLGTPVKVALAATAFVAGLALLASNKSLGNATAKAIYSTFTTPRLPVPDPTNLPRIVESGLEALNFVGAEKNIINKVARSVEIINRR